jgi:hypothetical protein
VVSEGGRLVFHQRVVGRGVVDVGVRSLGVVVVVVVVVSVAIIAGYLNI